MGKRGEARLVLAVTVELRTRSTSISFYGL